jgi:hypothetical protein
MTRTIRQSMYRGMCPGVLTLVLIALPNVVGAQDQQLRHLFNGKDLTGWEHVGPGEVVVEDNVLKTVGGMGLLWYTEEEFSNSVIRVVYRNPGGANSGVFIRIPDRPTEPWMPVNRGYEVQIDDTDDEFHVTGVLYSLTRAAAAPSRPDEWNTMEITLAGDRTVVRINDVLVTDYTEGQPVRARTESWEPERGPRPVSGFLGVQNHGEDDVAYFREISVRPLQPGD